MTNTLPVTKEISTNITYVTTTGIEKIFTILGIGTVTLLAFLGLVTIIILTIKAIRNGRK